MSSARIQKLNALLKRVEERRAQPRLQSVPATPGARDAAPVHVAPAVAPSEDEFDLNAPTMPPAASMEPPAPGVSHVEGPGRSVRPEPEPPRRGPSASPLEDAMAQLGAAREDSGPLEVPAFSVPTPSLARMSEPEVNQDLLLTHRPEAGPSAPPGPIVELVQPKHHGPREPTLQFDTGVKANPLLQRDLKPVGFGAEPPAEALAGPTQKVAPAPLPAQAAPARAVSSARHEAAKTFGELLDLSLSLRPASSGPR